MTKNSSPITPNWAVGLGSGLCLGVALGLALSNLALGISLAVCFGVSLSYALGKKADDEPESERPEQ
ncbi:hypothetical protein [Nonomuraea rubra]|uniref:hypothetical protein n=1 Tax=Nonomuraea rubra TaxID=46180 RepID=UPI0033DD7546